MRTLRGVPFKFLGKIKTSDVLVNSQGKLKKWDSTVNSQAKLKAWDAQGYRKNPKISPSVYRPLQI